MSIDNRKPPPPYPATMQPHETMEEWGWRLMWYYGVAARRGWAFDELPVPSSAQQGAISEAVGVLVQCDDMAMFLQIRPSNN